MNKRVKLVVVTSSFLLVLFLLLGSVLGRSTDPEDAYRHFAVYTEVLSRIKSEYVEEPDMKNVTLGAVNGLLEAVDPYASYLSADQYKQYLKAKGDPKAGVGLLLSRRFGYIGVVDAIPGSPADKAGLTTGDMLEAINGVATRDMPLAYAAILLRGDPGTTTKLTVMRVRQSSEPQKIDLVRAPVKYPPVEGAILQSDIGYLRVGSLEAGKAKQIAAKTRELEKQGAQRLILDLRHTAAGTTEEGIELANLFLDKGLITYLEGQKVPRKNFEATPATTVSRLPMVVITNRGTASGAEIAAAALLGEKRAEVVGERTYGDAGMQRPVTLEDGSAVILSVAKYHSPDGKAIQDVGVTPSVPVIAPEPTSDSDEDEPVIQPAPEVKPGEDKLLQKAIEVLTFGAPKAAKAQSDRPAEQGSTLGPLNVPRPKQ